MIQNMGQTLTREPDLESGVIGKYLQILLFHGLFAAIPLGRKPLSNRAILALPPFM